jgi:hypothetical protein
MDCTLAGTGWQVVDDVFVANRACAGVYDERLRISRAHAEVHLLIPIGATATLLMIPSRRKQFLQTLEMAAASALDRSPKAKQRTQSVKDRIPTETVGTREDPITLIYYNYF